MLTNKCMTILLFTYIIHSRINVIRIRQLIKKWKNIFSWTESRILHETLWNCHNWCYPKTFSKFWEIHYFSSLNMFLSFFKLFLSKHLIYSISICFKIVQIGVIVKAFNIQSNTSQKLKSYTEMGAFSYMKPECITFWSMG